MDVAKMRDAELVSCEVLVDGPKRFVREVLRMPDRTEIDWYFVDTAPSVMVVPVTESGDVVMTRQYRHNLKRDTLELPAGVVGPGERAPAAALRELADESGHALAPGGELHDLGNYHALPSETNKHLHFYLALGVRPAGTAQAATVTLPFEKAFSLIGAAIHGLETVAALLLARHALGEQG